jgi:hypothetical protein
MPPAPLIFLAQQNKTKNKEETKHHKCRSLSL